MKYELKFVIGKILHMAFAFLHVECLAFLPKYFHTGFAGNEKKGLTRAEVRPFRNITI